MFHRFVVTAYDEWRSDFEEMGCKRVGFLRFIHVFAPFTTPLKSLSSLKTN